MRKRTIAQTILVLVMFGLSLAIFLLFTMRGRFWWGVTGAIGSYLLLFWLTAPYLSQLDEPLPQAKKRPTRPWVTPPTTPPQELWLAEVVNLHGEAVYGRAGQYVDSLYYGRVTQGAVVQLLDFNPIQNDFGLLVLPVRVLFDPSSDVTNFGTAVWLKLDTLSIASDFRHKVGTFDLGGLRQERDRLYTYYEQYQPPLQISQPPTFPKGLVTAAFGTAVYGHEQNYDDKAYLTRLSQGDKLLLRSSHIQTNQHNMPIVLIELLATTPDSPNSLIGWVTLTDTTFADYYDPTTNTLHEL